MTGSVDSNGRALLPIRLRGSPVDVAITLDAWIGTAFTGELVLARSKIMALKLTPTPIVHAILADGATVELESFRCQIEWFGGWKNIEVVANDGQFPLLGVGLLRGRELRIDYARQTLDLRQ